LPCSAQRVTNFARSEGAALSAGCVEARTACRIDEVLGIDLEIEGFSTPDRFMPLLCVVGLRIFGGISCQIIEARAVLEASADY
jgi:hypothetical protein